MIQASVGFQCPDCVAAGRASQRGGRTSRAPGGRNVRIRSLASSSATVLLIGLIVIVQALDSISLGRVQGLLAYWGQAVLSGQVWRLVTHVIISGSILSLVINGFVLWLFGRSMEAMWGKWRFLATYFLSGLGAGAVALLAGPPNLVMGGASGAIIGLLAANAGGKLRTKEDARPDFVLLAILVGFSVFTNPWLVLADVGAILAGGACGWLWSTSPRPGTGQRHGSMSRTDQLHLRGSLAILGACVLVAALGFIRPLVLG